MTERLREPVAAVIAQADAAGARLLLYYECALNEPFVSGAGKLGVWHRILTDFAQERGASAVELGDELAGQNLPALSLDSVHFNVAGHRALVPIFERMVLGQLARKSQPQRSDLSGGPQRLRESEVP